jgi:guanylate kinase
LLLTSFLAVSSLDARDNAAFETQVEAIAEETTNQLLTVDIQYRADLVTQQPTAVTITVYGENPPSASTIRERIRTETGVDVPVTVITERVDKS